MGVKHYPDGHRLEIYDEETFVRQSLESYLNSGVLGLVPGGRAVQFRLTTESGVPISTTERVAQSTLFLTPYLGNLISLYNGTIWVPFASAQVSLALSGLTTGKNYDVFAFANGAAVALELSAAWASDTTRTDAIVLQDGMPVKSGAPTRLHVGTIRATGATTTEDSGGGVSTQLGGKRFVWNRYNRVDRFLTVMDTTASWSYTTAAIRIANGAIFPANCLEFVCGDITEVDAEMVFGIYMASAPFAATAGIGYDSSSAFSGRYGSAEVVGATAVRTNFAGRFITQATPGYHSLRWLELGAGPGGTQLWLGTVNSSSGLMAAIRM